METPPMSKSKKLPCKRANNEAESLKENEPANANSSPNLTKTPTNRKLMDREVDDGSPIPFPITQESNEDIDVTWDWNSPQAKERQRKKQKRLLPSQSPKTPIRRHPSNHQIQSFERLREELKALQEELAQPDDESCLCISPQQEEEFKQDNSTPTFDKDDHVFDDLEDVFNDSVDEQLVLFTQKVESVLVKGQNCDKSDFSDDFCNSEINEIINKYTTDDNSNVHIADDSLDKVLTAFKDDEVVNKVENTVTSTTFSAVSVQKTNTLKRTLSEQPINQSKNFVQTPSGKMEFHRTKSFEMDVVTQQNKNVLPSSVLEEIERKRLEALAKLKSKQRSEVSGITSFITSPTKCSSEEIEKKRQQALAKLQAKRMQDIVERNRQEALKRLQISRQKNATLVKGSLTKRL